MDAYFKVAISHSSTLAVPVIPAGKKALMGLGGYMRRCGAEVDNYIYQ